MTRGRRRGVAAVAVVTAMLIAAAPANAATRQRYVSPTGTGSACSSAAPCSLETAFGSQSSGDEIILASGEYGPIAADLNTASDIFVHGVHGQPAPRIQFAPSHYMTVNGGSRLSYVALDGSITEPLEVGQGTQADQVDVRSSDGSACLVYGTLIDSVCSTVSSNAKAIEGSIGGDSYAVLLRNDTAWSSGSGSTGIDYAAETNGHFTITAVNVIAHGESADVFAEGSPLPATTTVNIDHSNFVSGIPVGPGASINPTARQGQPPAFLNAAAGDFREAAGSPTVDAGITSPANGPFDFLGEPRVVNGATDIGADEFGADQVVDKFAGAILGQQKTKVRKRKAKVAVGCPAGVPPPCAGTLALTFRQGKKTLTAGSAAFSIQPGTIQPVTVKVSKKAWKLLGRRGKLRTQATATATDGAGTAATTTAPVKLKRKR